MWFPDDTANFIPIGEAFEFFCKGISSHGPYWDQEEEEEGVVEKVVKMCSFESLRDMEGNRSVHGKKGKTIESSAYFRKGIVGDWSCLSDEMGEKMNRIVEEKLKVSGFRFLSKKR
ncbi:hypothetical protein F3Y22_tig00110045pilonHSYRG00017 [Hibiscus syriacus]|uniref:Sulfotransferase n=1 Tax=Hibiscus syriacus TaxID=106335 RepID=A0A6A3BMZ4_HIBSY|nr:hypothetical protein F3Y22_tig00110045pilonHSYRG00017 [Hibiscus syriacus]